MELLKDYPKFMPKSREGEFDKEAFVKSGPIESRDVRTGKQRETERHTDRQTHTTREREREREEQPLARVRGREWEIEIEPAREREREREERRMKNEATEPERQDTAIERERERERVCVCRASPHTPVFQLLRWVTEGQMFERWIAGKKDGSSGVKSISLRFFL